MSEKLQSEFSSDQLDRKKLHDLLDGFVSAVKDNTFKEKGYSETMYGMSKLGEIALTKIVAREQKGELDGVYCMCPGYCITDMTSHRGSRTPAEVPCVTTLR